MTMNFEKWVNDCGWDENDLALAYSKVKLRRNIYGILTCFTPLFPVMIPFWVRAAYLTKSIKYRNLDVNPNGLMMLVYGISCLTIIPFILMLIIRKTNWGMGINNI